MGLIPYFSLAAGFLTGKYRQQGEAVVSSRSSMVADYLRPECFAVVEALAEIAAAHATEPAAVALTWLRDRPGVVAPLASARTAEQLAPILTALTLELAPEEIDRLTALSEAV